jgi:predicted membrane protein
VVLAVIGIGLVVGAFVRSGRGLIPIALLLGALTWGVLAAPLGQWDGNGFGDLKAAPTTVADLEPSYRRTAGDIDLDLRNLDLTVPAGGNSSPLEISVRLGVGDVQVWVPDNADLELKGKADVGRVAYGAHDESGPSAKIETTDLGADGVASGRQLVLDVRTGAGNVEVHRG